MVISTATGRDGTAAFPHDYGDSMDRLILAHDLGTSANKATLFSEDGKLVASATHPYQSDFLPGGVAEQNPEDWWTAVCASTQMLLETQDASRVAAIAFSGTMMGCLCVDKNGVPLRKHMMYCDQRATKQADEFIEKAGDEAIYRISGNRPSAAYCAAKYMWVKENQPDIYRNTHKMLNAKDYLNFRMTGRLATDPTDASGTNIYDLKTGTWSEQLIEASGLDASIFPDIVPSTQVLGELTGEAARAMGLRAGIPVMAGAADGMCASVGVGSVAPGNAYNCVGSSAWIAITSEKPIYDPLQRTITFAHAVPGLFNPMGIMQVGGGVYAWLKNVMCLWETEKAAREGGSVYELMNKAAASSPPGANGLIFLPHLLGERTPRWNSLARGGFVGLAMPHKRGDLIRAVLEGVALNLAISVDIFREFGYPIKEMTMIGGAAKGDVWRQIMADVYNAEILRPNYLDEATSTGAAVIAGIGSGIYKDFSVIDQFFRIVDKTTPNPANFPVYKRKKALFDKVYFALEPLFPEFADEADGE